MVCVFFINGIQRKPYRSGGKRDSAKRPGADCLSLEEICDRVAEMVAEILLLLPGMDFTTLMDMYWEQLSFWHEKAVNTAKAIRGVS